MEHDSTVFVGLDVHKESITVAYTIDMGDVELLGKIGAAKADIDRMCKRIQSKARHVRVVTKPGPAVTDSTGNSSREDLTAWFARPP